MFRLVFVSFKMYVSFSIRVDRSVCFAWYSCGSKCMFRLVFVWLEECFAVYSYGSSVAIRVAQRAFCIYINVLETWVIVFMKKV